MRHRLRTAALNVSSLLKFFPEEMNLPIKHSFVFVFYYFFFISLRFLNQRLKNIIVCYIWHLLDIKVSKIIFFLKCIFYLPFLWNTFFSVLSVFSLVLPGDSKQLNTSSTADCSLAAPACGLVVRLQVHRPQNGQSRRRKHSQQFWVTHLTVECMA